jgi:uncharacterized protein YceH (UPF0502 family)
MTAMPLPDESVATLDEIERRRAQRAETMRQASAVRRVGASTAAPLQAESYAAPGRRTDTLLAFGGVVAPRPPASPASAAHPFEVRVADLEARVAELERVVAELIATRQETTA